MIVLKPGSPVNKTRKEPKYILFERKSMIAKKNCWLVFDLNNGDADKGYYVWWFPSRKKARQHIAWQKQQRNSAELSTPIKFVRKKK